MCVINWRQMLSIGAFWLSIAWAGVSYASDAAVDVPVDSEQETTLDVEAAREVSARVTLFEQEVRTIESELGPYDANLVEVLSDLGRFYLELGQFQSAAQSFERALNITRISDGLYSVGQLEVLGHLINAYKAAGEWDEADDKEHLALHLSTRIYEPGTQAYADAALAFGEWKIQAVRGNLMERSALANMRDIEMLQDVYAVALGSDQEALNANSGMRVQTRFDLLYAKAYAEAQSADYALHAIPYSLQRPVQRYVSEYVCRDVVSATGQVSQSCGTVRRENPQYREYEMQRQFYRDRIQITVTSLDRSIDALQSLLDTQPALQSSNEGAGPARLAELRTMQTNINRDYRRNVMRW